MTQLDPSIILGAKPVQIESPVNALAKVMQMQGLQQQNQLGMMKMDEYRATGERRNKLASLLQGQYDTPEARESALLSGGFLDESQALGKSRLENQKSGLETKEKEFKLANDRYKTMQQSMGALYQRPDLSKELVLQSGQQLVQAGILPPEMYDKVIASMPDDPNALRQRLRDGLASQMTPEQVLTAFAPKAEKIDNGQSIGFRDMNPNSPTYGQNTGGAPVQKMQTPDSVASGQIAMRGQNMADARGRESNALKAKEIQMGGKPPPGYRWNGPNLEAIPGGPGDKLPESQQKQVVGVNNLSNAISEYRDELKKFGTFDAASPDKRAGMGTKYNNMMLQAKEAYNLGVLNGPDLEILTAVITDPRSLKGVITSKGALDKQASELDRIMQGIGQVSGQSRQPQNKPGKDSAPSGSGGFKILSVE